jgi:HAE1 family hydrophobic/amphiphilic exporter-1
VPIDFMIEEDRSEFNVWLKQPLGTGVEQTQEAVTAVEQTLREMPETRIIFSTIGAGAKQRVNEAQIYVQLVHKSERSGSQAELMARVRERIAGLELGLADFAIEEIPFIEVAGARSAQLMYAVRGPEVDRLHLFAGRLAHRLRATEGYRDVFLSYETGKPEIALDITRERAADLGVPVLQIGRTIASLYAGVEVGSYEEGGERYDVRVQVRPEYRDELHKLELVRVRSSSGALVPLTNLVTPRIGSGPVQIDREGRTRSITVYANLDGKAAAAADAEVSGFIRELSLPSGYEVVAIGPTERLRETTAAVIFAFVLALVAIYMILAAQFDSFVHPFTIMLSAPLSFLGAFAAVRLLGYSLDVMGQIAFLMLMGIVMKNGILLVDYTKTLRSRGLSRTDAILEAGPTRMRPVLMTATSTIFGMLPIAFGTGDGSEWRAPMGIVSIGGLAASTLLTLLVVPIVYSLFDEAGDWLRSLFARRRTAAAHARREAHGADAG